MSKVMPSGPMPARIMIVGEAPGENEVQKNEPFVGASGMELSRMLHDAGIMRSECFLTNVARERPYGNDIGRFVALKKKDITTEHVRMRDKYVTSQITEGVRLLQMEIEQCQPNVIIAFGNIALWALTGKNGIKSWRGSELETDLSLNLPYRPKIIPTYHPAYVLRDWSSRGICVQDLKRARRESSSRELTRISYEFVIRPSFHSALAVLDKLYERVLVGELPLSVDIETRGGHIACIGIAWSRTEALCIPLMCIEDPWGYWNEEEETVLMFWLYKLLTHANARVWGQNFLYDAQYFFRHLHYIPRVTHDTMLSYHVMFSNMPKGLDFLHSMFGEHYVYWKAEGKEWEAKMGEEQLWGYNCKDSVNTFEIAEEEVLVIEQMGLQEVHQFQQDLFWPVLETMNRGLLVDKKRRSEFALELQDEMAAREKWIGEVLGHPINLKSPKQMHTLFYEDLKQKVILHPKTRKPTLDDTALQRIGAREPLLRPLIRRISEYRSLAVFFSTFVSAPLDQDGRMRCSFNIAGTETYRFSSSQNAFGSGLNLQNIPAGGEEEDSDLELPNVRTLFIPDPGFTFFDVDLSSADLRIVVWEADEPEMKAMFAAGLDPYTELAKEFYNDSTIIKSDPRRQSFKAFTHGTNYLGTAEGLAKRIGLSVREAERTQNWYFWRFPRIKIWQDNLKDRISQDRSVTNIFGYKLHVLSRIEGTIFNQVAAWIPQSTVACLINRAYVNIYNNLKEVQVLLQVHDSLAGQYPTHLGDWAKKRILEEGKILLPYNDPCIIPMGIKTSNKSWGDCK